MYTLIHSFAPKKLSTQHLFPQRFLVFNLQYSHIHRYKTDSDVAINSLHSGEKCGNFNSILICIFVREVLQNLFSTKL